MVFVGCTRAIGFIDRARRRAVHRHTLPIRLSCGGLLLQFGRASMFPPPHLPHFMRGRNDGTSVSAG